MSDTSKSNYFPEPGDVVNLTVRATFDGNAYIVTDDGGREVFSTAPGSSYEVAVDPTPISLPSLPHAVIRAEVNRIKDLTLHRIPDEQNDNYPWCSRDGNWFGDDEITRVVEVLFPGVTQ